MNNFRNIFLSYLYILLIDKHTRVDKKRGTSILLDNINSNVSQITNTIHSGIFKSEYSNHYSIFCVADLVIRTRNTKFINKRDFCQKNISNLKKALDKYNWQSLPSNSCQTSFSHSQNIFSEYFINNFPTKPLKLNTTTNYHISQIDYTNQSNINIPLDILTSKIQLMKINRNVEHSITN